MRYRVHPADSRLVHPIRFVLAATMLLAALVAAGARPAVAATAPADRYVAGGSVTELAPVGGDLFAAGGSVDVDAKVGGDAFLAGGKVRAGGDVAESIYAAGGQVSLLAGVSRNARLVGGQVEIGPNARVGGNLTAAGGQVTIRGAVDGKLSVAARHVFVDAAISGDVDIAAGTVELGPNARLAGNLRYRSAETLQRAPSAQVLGRIETLGPEMSSPTREQLGRGVRTGLSVVWTVGTMLLAALVVAALPGLSASVSRTLRERLGASLVLGFVVLVCTPVAAILLFVTLIGIPLAILLTLAWATLMPLAWVGSAIAIGDSALSRVAAARAARTGSRVVAALAVVLALALVSRVPWIGTPLAFAVLLAGLGAWALQLRRLRD